MKLLQSRKIDYSRCITYIWEIQNKQKRLIYEFIKFQILTIESKLHFTEMFQYIHKHLHKKDYFKYDLDLTKDD